MAWVRTCERSSEAEEIAVRYEQAGEGMMPDRGVVLGGIKGGGNFLLDCLIQSAWHWRRNKYASSRGVPSGTITLNLQIDQQGGGEGGLPYSADR